MTHYDELAEVLQCAAVNIRIRYTELYRILCVLLEEATAGTGMDFSGPFARLTYIFQNGVVDSRMLYALNALRRKCLALQEHDDEELSAFIGKDTALVARLTEKITGAVPPDTLAALLPAAACVPADRTPVPESVKQMRVSVLSWDAEFIRALPDGELHNPIRIAYTHGGDGHEAPWKRIGNLLQTGTQLGLLRCTLVQDICTPEIIIYEPDYLVDVSTVAACFKAYGATPYAHLINRLGEKQNTEAILLGNFAGQLLDEEVHRQATAASADYASSARRFMHQQAPALLALGRMSAGFHQAAQCQQAHIRDMLNLMRLHDKVFSVDHVLLEASFLCEPLGLQGRMDLITDDCRILMEQKSGKRDEFRHRHAESHYVQMLLYQAMIHYGRGLRNDEISCYLMYSKYADGLLKEGVAPALLRQALQIRNRIAWLDFRLCREGSQLLEKLRPEHLRGKDCNERFWQQYAKEPLNALLQRVTQAEPVVKAYYHRMMSFVSKEHLLAKIGAPGREADGMASLWRSSLEEKLVAGNILMGLSIAAVNGEDDTGVHAVRFRLSARQQLGIPNFRVGDVVLCYAYPKDSVPDVRQAVVFRSFISAFELETVEIELHNPQRNTHVFCPQEGWEWALEHDCIESGFSTLYRSLYSLFTTTPERRSLLLGQREAGRDTEVRLLGDYSQGGKRPHFNELVLRARQASDYFILIGPPGTGKTSFGMVNILLETLSHPQETVLLLSYTNRAVDEICSKLVQHGIDFVRVGRASTCEAAYRPYLFEEKIKTVPGIADIGALLAGTRVFVGTTTSVQSRPELLKLKTFDVAIVDEASQILEPHLMGILCAVRQGRPAVRKFILIGDHKQLPAVVQQPAADSQVREKELLQTGLEDCRESLFQRLIRLQERTYGTDSPFIFMFTRQGRMHPEVARFAATHFYENRLQPVPLPHQERELCFPNVDPDNPLQAFLATHRTMFFPSRLPQDNLSPKTNSVEARMIARIVHNVYRLYVRNGRSFVPQETIGVIVPYRLQIVQVQQELARTGIAELSAITVDTVERYQGSQRDVIVYGFTVRQPYQLQFLCSQSFVEHGQVIDRKLNVALTRAREQMVLVGHVDTLCQDDVHRALIEEIGIAKQDFF